MNDGLFREANKYECKIQAIIVWCNYQVCMSSTKSSIRNDFRQVEEQGNHNVVSTFKAFKWFLLVKSKELAVLANFIYNKVSQNS